MAVVVTENHLFYDYVGFIYTASTGQYPSEINRQIYIFMGNQQKILNIFKNEANKKVIELSISILK
jgi:hypothetical protein